jgi:hypothetical protein
MTIIKALSTKLVDLVLRRRDILFFSTNIFKARLGRSSTTLHLLKHHIKPLASASAFTPLSLTSHQVLHLLKLLWVLLFYASAISLLCTFLCFEKCNCLFNIFFGESLRRFVLIDLVDQIFKLESKDFIAFDKTVSNKLMIPAWWFVFVFS